MERLGLGIASLVSDCADGVAHAAVVGELDGQSSHHVGKRLDGMDASVLVLDLSAVTFCDSGGLHMLEDLRARFGACLSIASPSPAVLRVLDVMEMTDRYRTVS
jgi:anti-anti-sigma factor